MQTQRAAGDVGNPAQSPAADRDPSEESTLNPSVGVSLGETVDSAPVGSRTASGLPARIARFIVLGRLGAGGMGIVYEARDPQLDRRVALKLVRPGSQSTDAQERLLREAQAMARLNHPNVVSVFDVGTHDGGVWIAMEFVEGQTLRECLRELRGAHSLDARWEQILVLFRQAGAGLAAAHAAGLIHRDFKPDNVLIGSDGRARVADFGLVRPADGFGLGSVELEPDASETSDASERSDPIVLDWELEQRLLTGETVDAGARLPRAGKDGAGSTPSGGGLGAQLTADGALVGTPRYMSPEQFRRLPAGAAADQFAFCVALYHALYAAWPFAGDEFYELAAAVTLSDAKPAPIDTPVPALIGAAVMRGLSRSPKQRFPEMEALLDALKLPEPRRRRWPLVVASVASALGAAALAGWFVSGPEPVDVCAQGPAQISETWGPARREGLSTRFEQHGLNFAGESLAAVDAALSSWTKSWAGTYAETCETRHEQSPQGYELRMACLAEQREQVEGLLELFDEADAELVRDAPELVASLPALDGCALLAEYGELELPTPAQREGVQAGREALARIRGRLDAGRSAGVADELERLTARAAELGYAPFDAELEAMRGLLAENDSREEDARAHALRAHEQALAVGHDRLALDTAHKLIRLDSYGPGDQGVELARRWHAVASGFEQRLGSQPRDAIKRRFAYGRSFSVAMRYSEAHVELRAALELARELYGPSDLRTVQIELSLGLALGDGSKWEEAGGYLAHSLDVYERSLSPTHPLLIRPLLARLGQSLAAGKLESARVDGERMLAISELAFGPAHISTIESSNRLAIVHDLRGDHERAVAQFRSVLERSGEAEQLKGVRGLRTTNSLCFSLYKLGRLEDARAACERALAAAPELLGPRHPIVAIVLNNLALIARAEGDDAQSLILDRRALALCEESVGPEHVYTAYALVGIAEVLLTQMAQRQAREAVTLLERAVEIRSHTGDPGEQGEAECLLARAQMLASPRAEASKRVEAQKLGATGLEHLRQGGRNWTKQAEDCDTWLGSMDVLAVR